MNYELKKTHEKNSRRTANHYSDSFGGTTKFAQIIHTSLKSKSSSMWLDFNLEAGNILVKVKQKGPHLF